jgi:2-dehydro-3-deoxygluconokinase
LEDFLVAELLTIGEPMALFASTQANVPLASAVHFDKYMAGAEVNVAVGVARLGHTTQYITQLGMDPFGTFIKQQLAANQVGTDYIGVTPDHFTGLQLKDRVTNGDPDTFYFRRDSAAAHFDPHILTWIDFADVRRAHLTGIFPAISEQALQVTRQLIALLQQHQVPITFDPNLRPALWPDKREMVTTINQLAAQADIVLPGISEGQQLMGSRDPAAIADFYLHQSDRTQAVIVKLGPAGAYYQTRTGDHGTVAGFTVDHVVDTVGAGDGFAVGVIAALLDNQSLAAAARRGNAVGAMAVQSAGDNTGYPTPAQLTDFFTAQTARQKV